jgi:hypothetical protein
MTPTRKSSVWKHFSKGNDGTATRRFCKKKLKTSGNTTNLISHKVLVQKEGEIGENKESKKEDISEKPSMDVASSRPSTSQQRTTSPTPHKIKVMKIIMAMALVQLSLCVIHLINHELKKALRI